ncbi:hypothetical protein NDU88_004073, partial [Pleurodeles waltl]
MRLTDIPSPSPGGRPFLGSDSRGRRIAPAVGGREPRSLSPSHAFPEKKSLVPRTSKKPSKHRAENKKEAREFTAATRRNLKEQVREIRFFFPLALHLKDTNCPWRSYRLQHHGYQKESHLPGPRQNIQEQEPRHSFSGLQAQA